MERFYFLNLFFFGSLIINAFFRQRIYSTQTSRHMKYGFTISKYVESQIKFLKFIVYDSTSYSTLFDVFILSFLLPILIFYVWYFFRRWHYFCFKVVD